MRNIQNKRAGGENNAAYLSFVCIFALGCILGMLVARQLPRQVANAALAGLQMIGQKSKIEIFFILLAKLLAAPLAVAILAYFRIEKLSPITFFVMGAVVSYKLTLCALAGGAGGYFAAMLCYVAICFAAFVGALIIVPVAMRVQRRQPKYSLPENILKVIIILLAFYAAFALLLSLISPLVLKAALGLLV